jgi:tRNA(Arg) A34 adenosine deaminase TadA
MCLAAIYWARLGKIFYAGTRRNAAAAGFDDNLIYSEMARPVSCRKIPMQQLLHSEGLKVFKEWQAKPDKIRY